jgi:uncharacterized BrkB/YihY/UPF0761 family membrane protein
MKLKLVKEIFGLSILVAVLHMIALKFYLYWVIDWFDIPMHFLGSLLIGLIVISFLFRVIIRGENFNKKLFISAVFLGVMVVGLGWELFELFFGMTDLIKDRADTIMDLIMDAIGSAFSILYYYFKYSK